MVGLFTLRANMRNFTNYARMHNNRVIHQISTSDANWAELNPWPDVPGEWEIVPSDVRSLWERNPETGAWIPYVDPDPRKPKRLQR